LAERHGFYDVTDAEQNEPPVERWLANYSRKYRATAARNRPIVLATDDPPMENRLRPLLRELKGWLVAELESTVLPGDGPDDEPIGSTVMLVSEAARPVAQHNGAKRRVPNAVADKIHELHGRGRGDRVIARKLNELGMRTLRGTDWTAAAVYGIRHTNWFADEYERREVMQ
jgi:hypothetical protein